MLCLVASTLIPSCRPEKEARVRGTDHTGAVSLTDSADARRAVERYLAALAAHEFSTAAGVFSGAWRPIAAHVLDDAPLPDTLTLGGYLRQTCGSGFYICGLKLRRVTETRLLPADTLLLTVEFSDSTGRRYEWGPCCGRNGDPETAALFRAVAIDSGFAVSTLPLYVP